MLSKQEKKRIRFYRKVVVAGLVLALGLTIVNAGSPINLFKSMVATEEDYHELATKIETYIVAEYERQKETNAEDVNLASIVSEAKRLNDLGLTITYNDSYFKSISIFKELDTAAIQIKKIELNN